MSNKSNINFKFFVKLVDGSFNDVSVRVRNALEPVVINNLQSVCIKAKELVPKDTTATEAAIHVVHRNLDGEYESAIGEARQRRSDIDVFSASPIPANNLIGYVFSPATYSHVLEEGLGTGKSSVPRPFMGPAIQEQEPIFNEEVKLTMEKAISGSKRTKRSNK